MRIQRHQILPTMKCFCVLSLKRKTLRSFIHQNLRTLDFWFCFRHLVGRLVNRLPKAERSENNSRPSWKQNQKSLPSKCWWILDLLGHISLFLCFWFSRKKRRQTKIGCRIQSLSFYNNQCSYCEDVLSVPPEPSTNMISLWHRVR